jgi:hypothetical protein
MRFAFISSNGRAEKAAPATGDNGLSTGNGNGNGNGNGPGPGTEPGTGPELEPLAAAPGAPPDAAEAMAHYDEYLSELDKVPTLRDPVQPDASGQQLNLDDRIREIVRDELAKLQPAPAAQEQEQKRGSARPRKRRKR